MKIGYREIFDLYRHGDDFFICYALREAFGSDINSADFMKAVGIDMYGPVLGRLRYWVKWVTNRGDSLQNIYPDIGELLEPNAGPPYSACSRTLRLDLLLHLAETHPERKFDIQYFL